MLISGIDQVQIKPNRAFKNQWKLDVAEHVSII